MWGWSLIEVLLWVNGLHILPVCRGSIWPRGRFFFSKYSSLTSRILAEGSDILKMRYISQFFFFKVSPVTVRMTLEIQKLLEALSVSWYELSCQTKISHSYWYKKYWQSPSLFPVVTQSSVEEAIRESWLIRWLPKSGLPYKVSIRWYRLCQRRLGISSQGLNTVTLWNNFVLVLFQLYRDDLLIVKKL